MLSFLCVCIIFCVCGLHTRVHVYEEASGRCRVSSVIPPYFFEAAFLPEPGVYGWQPASHISAPFSSTHGPGVTSACAAAAGLLRGILVQVVMLAKPLCYELSYLSRLRTAACCCATQGFHHSTSFQLFLSSSLSVVTTLMCVR